MQALIERITRRAHDPKCAIWIHEGITVHAVRQALVAFPPVSQQAVDAAEQLLGFALPPLLRALYTTVGNGNFGPGYGLPPIDRQIPPLPYKAFENPRTLVQAYYESRLDPHWPEKLVFLCDWGCAIESYVDCNFPDAPIFRLDPNQDLIEDDPTFWRADLALEPEASSLATWLEAWVEDRLPFYPLLGE